MAPAAGRGANVHQPGHAGVTEQRDELVRVEGAVTHGEKPVAI